MTRPFAFAFVVLLAAGAGAPALQAAPADDAAIVHALNRLTYGPRPGDVERVKAMGLQKWIEAQLAPSRIDDGALTAKLRHLETLTLDSETIQRDYAGPAMAERRKRAAEGADRNTRAAEGTEGADKNTRAAEGAGQTTRATEGTEGSDQNANRMMRDPMNNVQRKARQVISDIEEAKLLRAVYSERQLEEVLVDFWFNHFNVFAGKGATRNYVSEYEREAIRPYVLGQFRDMLGATAKSPAMLFYLDNWLSSAGEAREASESRETGARRRFRRSPGSPASPASPAAPARRSRGINENYARELLELHTLGVDGGYTQQDIVNVAKAFTGWTIQPRQGSGFMFVAARHERGEKVVLGQTIKAGGIDEGERVLDIVAAHPATARHIAKKLAMRFVSDNPPAALVDRAAARFTATRGDLREVLKVILASPEFAAADAYRAKVKTPLEFVASALRATGAEVRTALPLARTLRDMGMPLYFCQPPTGYDETATTWVSAGALVARMNFAVDLSKNAVRGVRVPLSEEQTLAMKIGAPEFQRQ
ncbi:MAG TPA: DUF1800 domain-containing protein [Vicinamibacterales bacterium]|nr:DUF1800 domain-containing protein [Vicinamibacterales bacterium]